jgi:hypothetical protein
MKVTASTARAAALAAWDTRRKPINIARRTEAASKRALEQWCQENHWKVVFFEGASGFPRTGIVDAVMVRIKPAKPDAIEVRLVQLKAGVAGLKAVEIGRLKKAVAGLSVDWLFAAYDKDKKVLHLVPDVPKRGDVAV